MWAARKSSGLGGGACAAAAGCYVLEQSVARYARPQIGAIDPQHAELADQVDENDSAVAGAAWRFP
jgi:hypothetical protein